METVFNNGLMWWVSVIEIPALAGLMILFLKLRDTVTADKLEAWRSFANIGDVRDLEKRLVSHLLRIEAKLDVTALKAEGLFQAHGGSHD
jgi:hypothetical protein